MDYEFHISRKIRDLYKFDDKLFSLSGNVVFADIKAARIFAQKMNQMRDLARHPEKTVKPGDITAMGLIDEILHYVVGQYREQINKKIMGEALDFLYKILKKEKVDKALYSFVEEFPPVDVYRKKISEDEYLNSKTKDVPNREIVLEEMLMLWLANMNPAFSLFSELFNDTSLKRETVYLYIIAGLREFFDKKQYFGPYNQNLIDMLRSPAIIVPYSLKGQLDYIREHWLSILKRYMRRLLGSLDLIKEEAKITFTGPGRAQVYDFRGLELETERFSPDREWMPRLVLLAKNIYVWLDQLSKKYGCHITRLSEIPDEELDTMKTQGFSGLWIIGIWERSPASQKIKQLCGNPEAVSSAYSLFDYQISMDLGGEGAYNNLKERAWQRGIRLASDMVPNHVGIYSKWVIEHPDWFISLDYNPFPWYSFSGENLSHDDRVSIQIEDHYYSRTDAAVVFRRLDRLTGSERFVYHGNDGTSMPWNDTAQLNYLNPEVREAMIQTILYVARKFPVIRFDAAMTLTKKHYQRLWYPEPGQGGDIPTRAEYGLTRDEFNSKMPKEFWREVVDRVAQEAPDTLLLAEAFWLLEGYFVRTLGMHRVYNSAFMNMLRDEDNAKYRMVMKNILEFDPEILRRLVNFMNNPDERTAVDQFGKDNKYFGVCIMMVTMPGLPMFGHGQIEGYTEKYGMEYKRAYLDEKHDLNLIQRHEKEIFPLLHKRYIFAGIENFLLYDFYTDSGHVNEDVFAYSNRFGSERAVVVYNNKNNSTRGWIKTSAAYSVKAGGKEQRILVQRNLIDGLSFSHAGGSFIVFRDHVSGLAYIRDSNEIYSMGLYTELGQYHYHVFMDFQEVLDDEQHTYSDLKAYLNGRGFYDIETAIRQMRIEQLRWRFKSLVNVDLYKEFNRVCSDIKDGASYDTYRDFAYRVQQQYSKFTEELKRYLDSINKADLVSKDASEEILLKFGSLQALLSLSEEMSLSEDNRLLVILNLFFVCGLDIPLADELGLYSIISDNLREYGFSEKNISDAIMMMKIFTRFQGQLKINSYKQLNPLLISFLNDDTVQRFLNVNLYKDVLWFGKEALEVLLNLILIVLMLINGDIFSVDTLKGWIDEIMDASEGSGFKLENFLVILKN